MRMLLASRKVIIVCVASAIASASGEAAQPEISKRTAIGFEWTVEHASDADRTVRCAVIVRDLSNGTILAQPVLRSGWGEKAEIRECGRKWCLEADVLVSESGVKAQYEAHITVKGKVLAENRATVSLGDSGQVSASDPAASPTITSGR
jgi:hypothetical protein